MTEKNEPPAEIDSIDYEQLSTELIETLRSLGLSRRQMLGVLATGTGVAGLSNFASQKAAAASGNNCDGVCASDYSGSTGGAQIQNAMDSFGSDPSVIIVGADGPDDVSGYSYSVSDSRANSAWLISSTLEVPSNTTLVLQNAYLFLDNAVDNNIIRNNDTMNGNQNISIHAVGNPMIDGNAEGQSRDGGPNDKKFSGIRTYKTDNVSVRGFWVRNTNGWGIHLEHGDDFLVKEIRYDQNDKERNQDGIHVVGPSQDVRIEQQRGRAGDDLVAVEASASSQANAGNGGDVRNVFVSDIGHNGLGAQGIFRSIAGDGYTLDGLTIHGVQNIDSSTKGKTVLLGWNGVGSEPTPDEHTNITISGLVARNVDKAVKVETNVSNVSIESPHVEGNVNKLISQTQGGTTIDGLDITGGVIDMEDGGTPSGSVLNLHDTVYNLNVTDLIVRNAKYGFYCPGDVNGYAADWQVDNIGSNMYRYPSNVRFGGDMPAHDSEPGQVKGSTVTASASWDPDGDGNAERIKYDGTSWQEIVDLPNW